MVKVNPNVYRPKYANRAAAAAAASLPAVGAGIGAANATMPPLSTISILAPPASAAVPMDTGDAPPARQTIRRPPPRAAKAQTKFTRPGLRKTIDREARRKLYDEARERAKRARVRLKENATFRAARPKLLADFAKYPAGSYGGGRYKYLNGDLKGLGGAPKTLADLMDFSTAPVEVDHSPADSSQRKGERNNDAASMYRVAVPLPRAWHRRHITTHGPGATRTDAGFAADQKDRVSGGNYAEALKKHLLDTFHPAAVGSTAPATVEAVARHTMTALDYAAGPIPESIHKRHKKGTAAISPTEHAEIRQALEGQMNALMAHKKVSRFTNPFKASPGTK